MARISIQTSLGEIWLWGEPDRLKGRLPALLVIAGVFCRPDAFWFRLQERMPQAAVFAAQLPGHLCPALSETSIAAFVRAFSEAVAQTFSGRPVLVCGDSIGGTVALGLPNPGIGRVALDPPLRTAGLWPLTERFAGLYAADPARRAFLSAILGFDGVAFRDIDYSGLVQHPARVFMGEIPLLPPRELAQLPSLMVDEDRRRLEDARFIHTSVVMGAGHVMIWYEDFIVQMFGEELDKTIARWPAGEPDGAADGV